MSFLGGYFSSAGAETPSAAAKSPLKFHLNGEQVVVENYDPRQMLLEYLRDSKGLTGTKRSCLQGGCGACARFEFARARGIATTKRSKDDARAGLGEVLGTVVGMQLRPLRELTATAEATHEGPRRNDRILKLAAILDAPA